MECYKVKDRHLVSCPVNAVLEDGSSVCNYHLLPAEQLEADGWKSEMIEDSPPAYDEDSQVLVPWYEDCGGYIARHWEIVERIVQPDPLQMQEALQLRGVDTTGGSE